MIGHGTAYQRAGLILTSLLSGQLTIHLLQRRTVVLAFLLTAVFTVAGMFTWQIGLSGVASIVVWCALNGAIAGVLRPAAFSVYAELFGRDKLDSVLLHANLWDSVGAAMAVLIADELCLAIRAWIVVFVAGAAAVAYAGLECPSNSECRGIGGDSDSDGSTRSVAGVVNAAEGESLASVCQSPTDIGSVSTISNNRMSGRLHRLHSRAL